MTPIDPLTRTVHEVLETNLVWQNAFDNVNVKKAYTFVKYVTGKSKSDHTDYYTLSGKYYGYDTLLISGQKGFIKLALRPLFERI